MSKISEKDEVVTDEATGLQHKVFAGQPVPGHLLSEEDRAEAIGVTQGQQPTGAPIADKDEVRTDKATGLTYKVVAGQPIPPHLRSEEEQQEAEKATTTTTESAEQRTARGGRRLMPKVQTAPDKER